MSKDTQFQKWPSIKSFTHIWGMVHRFSNLIGEVSAKVGYVGKVKLHGTNAAIGIVDGKVAWVQKRSSSIKDYVQGDNCGFGKWVHEVFADNLIEDIGRSPFIVYGEWCGPGVQKGVAASLAPGKFFAIFAGKYVDSDKLITSVSGIQSMIRWSDDIDDQVLIIPDYHYITIDFADKAYTETALEDINKVVMSVEEKDPLMFDKFGVSGVGECFVYYPIVWESKQFSPLITQTSLMFKSKGPKHQTVNAKKPTMIDPIVAAKLNDLIDAICPPARLDQGIKEVFGDDPIDIRRMSDYLKWLGNDVRNECMVEIKANGF